VFTCSLRYSELVNGLTARAAQLYRSFACDSEVIGVYVYIGFSKVVHIMRTSESTLHRYKAQNRRKVFPYKKN
jgi:hypothetical protein